MKSLLVILSLLLSLGVAQAQDGARTQTVHFPSGKTSTTISDKIKGYESVDYVIGARAGQKMVVSLESGNTSNYFNVSAPGMDEAMFVGSISGNRFEAQLPADGDYVIDVYLMRNAARRNETAAYKLDIAITGAAAAAQPASDALVEGTDFNATGEVPCSRLAGQPTTNCRFGVKRQGNGDAQVTIFWPDGGSRLLTFEGGELAGADLSQADGDAKLSSERMADLLLVRVGEQRFEIPDVVVQGD